MLKNGLCDRVIFSDISKGSLAKAEKLLAAYVEDGRATPVLGDGFFGVPKDTEQALIAGMGGHEIVQILSNDRYGFIPKYFVFQPMLNPDLLRRYLVKNGARILRDFTFFDGKFYDVIVGEYAADIEVTPYTEDEFLFGKENLATRPEAFINRLKILLSNVEKYLSQDGLQEESRRELLSRKEKLEGVLYGDRT
jgi:tRNA (adenine22-N1)-methyltransferase